MSIKKLEQAVEDMLTANNDWITELNRWGGIQPELSEGEAEIEAHLETIGIEN